MTFTGLPKQQDFALHRARFASFEHKLVYRSLAGTIPPNSEPFVVEGAHRGAMTRLLKENLASTKNGRKPLVVFSDTDELPSAHTIRLLKKCAFQSPLHLRMRTFLYSFEWPYGDSSWRAQVHDWGVKLTNYGHSMQSDVALADAGWHCSCVHGRFLMTPVRPSPRRFCFRYLDEFVTKMRGTTCLLYAFFTSLADGTSKVTRMPTVSAASRTFFARRAYKKSSARAKTSSTCCPRYEWPL